MAKTTKTATAKTTPSEKSSAPISVTDFLLDTGKISHGAPIFVLFGGDDFLKHEALVHLRSALISDDEEELSWVRLDTDALKFVQLIQELATVAMFGDRRVIVLEDADKFVTENRESLEKYLENPSTHNQLVLTLKTFPSNTKLAKKVAASGVAIEASPLAERAIPEWITRWSQSRHQIACTRDAAELLVSLAGTDLGMLDQELARLALCINAPEKNARGKKGNTLTVEQVEANAGSWRTRTAFDILDLALAGKTADALRHLGMLLAAGEEPIGILAQLSHSFRKLSAATMVVIETERAGRKTSVSAALKQVGVNPYVATKMEPQLRHLGRARGQQLAAMLLQADLDLKGASRLAPRIILERLLTQLK